MDLRVRRKCRTDFLVRRKSSVHRIPDGLEFRPTGMADTHASLTDIRSASNSVQRANHDNSMHIGNNRGNYASNVNESQIVHAEQ